MPNPAKPLEQKRLLGNPGKRAMPKISETMTLESGWVEPLRPLQEAGQQLWDSVFKHGELWVSGRTDVHLLQLTAEQMDRRQVLVDLWRSKPTDKNLLMRLGEIEKSISSNLGLLGFTPSDRSRLGLAEIKAKSKLQEMMEKNG